MSHNDCCDHAALKIIGLVFILATTASAQEAGRPLVVREAIAVFRDALALDVDPTGKLYVLDADRSVILQIDSSGTVLNTWGGAGSGAYAFDEPSDFDPTNGLTLFVADTGNRLIKRYSREFAHLESIPFDLTPETAGVSEGGLDPFDDAQGRPIAVRQAVNGELFALDEERGVVVKWDAGRRVERVFGGYDAGEGALEQPVALALGDDGTIFVADAGQASVVVFDQFGNYVRSLAAGRATDVQRLGLHNGRLLIVLPRRVLVYGPQGRFSHAYEADLGEPLRDVAVANRLLYLLTPTRLLSANP